MPRPPSLAPALGGRANSGGASALQVCVISAEADLLAGVRRVRQVADVFGPASTALSMRNVVKPRSGPTTKRSAEPLTGGAERNPALSASLTSARHVGNLCAVSPDA
jgi:hypothetical protein